MKELNLENPGFKFLIEGTMLKSEMKTENRLLAAATSPSSNLTTAIGLLDSTKLLAGRIGSRNRLLEQKIDIYSEFAASPIIALSQEKENTASPFLSSPLLASLEATSVSKWRLDAALHATTIDLPKSAIPDSKFLNLASQCENTLLKTSGLATIGPLHGSRNLLISGTANVNVNVKGLLDPETIHIPGEQKSETEPAAMGNVHDDEESSFEPKVKFRDDFEINVASRAVDDEIYDTFLHTDDEPSRTRALKIDFVNAVSGALISSPNFADTSDQTRQFILDKATVVAALDPEFILKVAVYSRRELNLRTPSNFLLAVAASIPECRRFLKVYFNAAVILPTDWVEVAELYQTMPDGGKRSNQKVSLPAALRRAMSGKFPEFDVYQLGKHNKQKKTNKKKMKEKIQKQKARRGRWYVTKEERELEAAEKSKGKLNLKRLIRTLHIQKPAFNVMALVGKKYPSDQVAFQRSGLLGVFDASKAGKRMKLPIPETWETRLAREGNKAEVWQQLLDKRKLPFMAMLRNLKNMIRVGIAPEYHTMVLKRLQDETAVTQSKQFPFRFFSAYQALDDLRTEYEKKTNEIATAQAVSVKMLVHRKKRQIKWWAQKRHLRKARQDINYDDTLLNRYRKALDMAVKIATAHNVSPINGRTIVFCKADSTMDAQCTGTKGLGKPKTTMEIGALLSLLCKYVCEDCTFMIFTDGGIREIQLAKGTILKNVEVVLEQAATLRDETATSEKGSASVLADTLRQYTVERVKINNLLLVTNTPGGSEDDLTVVKELKRYRDLVCPELLYVNINLAPVQSGTESSPSHPRNVYLRGYSDQILRYIAIRGSDAQLIRIDRMDDVYKLKKEKKDLERRNPTKTSDFDFLTAGEPQATNVIKVFVSSTFRDMHGERTVLLRYVFPELQRRAARLGLTIVPIDLRWGISELDAHSMKSLELCLHEVTKCQLFVGLLGERRGWRPLTYSVSDSSDEFAWLTSHPPGASVTELEIEQFALQDVDKAKGRCFFYFREKLADVPEDYRPDMYAESDEAAKAMARLKMRIRNAGHPVMENYPCQWSGVHEGFPAVSNLGQLAQRVVDDLWDAICGQYASQSTSVNAETESDHISSQWNIIDTLDKKFVGRDSVVESVLTALQKLRSGIVALDAPPSHGLTSVLARLASIVKANQLKYGTPIVFFSDASRGQLELKDAIRYLFDYLTLLKDGKARRLSPGSSITQVMWIECVKSLCDEGYQLLFILDGLPAYQLEWLLETTGTMATFLISDRNVAAMLTSFEKRKSKVVRIKIGGLDRSDSVSLIRSVLAGYGKRFDESVFSGQMRLLLSKRDSDKPAYILSACEYLRLYAASEKIAPLLMKLPSTIDSLAKMVIAKAEAEHGSELIMSMLAFVAYHESELSTDDLYQLCILAGQSRSQKVKKTGAYRRLPYSAFLFGLNALRIVLLEETVCGRSTWRFLDGNIGTMVKARCSNIGFTQRRCLELLADYLLKSCDPSGDVQFRGLDQHNSALLPRTLASLGDWERLCRMLSSVNVVKRSFELGGASVSSLLAYRSIVAKGIESSKSLTSEDRQLFLDLSKFLSRNCDFLLRYPNLVNQQMLNEPLASMVSPLASSSLDDGAVIAHSIVRWESKPGNHSFCDRSFSFPKDMAIRAVAMSPKVRLIAVAVGCVVKLFDCESGQEVHAFVGHQDVVNDVCFVNDTCFCSCGDDGLVIVWDTEAKTKMATLEGHAGHVSMCIPYHSSRTFNLITVGWDSSIRLWNYITAKIYETISVKPASPINCIDTHSYDATVVTGHWNGTLMIHCLDPGSRKAILRGHKSAVRAVGYYKTGSFIASASFDGEVRLWSAEYGTTVGSFIGHLAPVNRILLTKDHLLSASDDCAIKLWSPMLGQPQKAVAIRDAQQDLDSAVACALSPDGRYLAVGYACQTVVMSDLENRNHRLWTILTDSMIYGLRFVPLSKNLLVTCRSSVQVFDFETAEAVRVFDAGQGNVECADCSSSILVVCHPNGAICFYLMNIGQQRSVNPSAIIFAPEGSITSCAFSPDGSLVATVATDKSLYIWKTSDVLAGKTKVPMKTFPRCHGEWISSCAWSNTKSIIATASSDCMAKLWDVDGDGEPLVTLKGHTAPLTCVRMKRGCVVTASLDGTVGVWSHKGVLVTQLKPMGSHRDMPTSLDFLLDRSSFTNIEDQRSWAEIMDDEEPAEQSIQEPSPSSEGTLCTASINDSMVAVCYTGGQCRIWKPFLGDERVSLVSHTGSVFGLDAVATESDLRFVSGGADGRFNMWSIGISEKLESRETVSVHRGTVTCISTRPAGDLVCSGGLDGTCALLCSDGESRRFASPYVWQTHEKSVSCIVWANDERLVTGGEDGMIKLWATREDEEDPVSCADQLSLQQPVASLTHTTLEKSAFIAAVWSGDIFLIGWKPGRDTFLSARTIGSSNGTIRSLHSVDHMIHVAIADQSEISRGQNGTWKMVEYPKTSCLSKFDSTVQVGTDDGQVIAVSSDRGEEEFRFNAHTSAVTGIATIRFDTENGEVFFATASKDCFVRLWKKTDRIKLVGLWQAPAPLTCMTVSDAGQGKLWCGDALGRIHELTVL